MITTLNEWKQNEAKQQLDLVKLESELAIFRKDMEERNEWIDDKECFKGTCQDITNELVEYLTNLGYNAVRTRGYYKNTNDEFYPNTDEWDYKDQELFSRQYHRNGDTCKELKFPHWWIEIDKYIIDLTEDQFHPGEEDEYRIGIYKKPDTYYKRG